MRKWEALVEPKYGGSFSGLTTHWQYLWSRSWEIRAERREGGDEEQGPLGPPVSFY